MTEIKQKKVKAENLNNRISDAIIVRKTRQRVGENKKQVRAKRGAASSKENSSAQKKEEPSAAAAAATEVSQPSSIDKEQELRLLLEEAKSMKL